MSQQLSIRLVEDHEASYPSAGRQVRLALTPADVVETTELSTYLAGYYPPGFRADDVSPVVMVDRDEFQFRSFSQNDAFKRVFVKGSLQGGIPEVDPESSIVTARVVDRYLGSFIPWVTENQGGTRYNVRMAAARRIRRAVELDREIDVWTMLTTTGNWNGSMVYALGATANWNGGSASNPILNLQALSEGSVQNTMNFWMNDVVANAFLRHDAVRDYMRFFLGDANALSPTLAAINTANARNASPVDLVIPGIGTLHIVPGKYFNAAGALTRVLGNSFVVATAGPVGTPTDGEEISTTYTFRRAGPNGTGFNTREFRDEARGPYGGTMLVAALADIAVMTANNVGGLITGVVT
jgi:hypothetical protein